MRGHLRRWFELNQADQPAKLAGQVGVSRGAEVDDSRESPAVTVPRSGRQETRNDGRLVVVPDLQPQAHLVFGDHLPFAEVLDAGNADART